MQFENQIQVKQCSSAFNSWSRLVYSNSKYLLLLPPLLLCFFPCRLPCCNEVSSSPGPSLNKIIGLLFTILVIKLTAIKSL